MNPEIYRILLIADASSTWFMTGLVWFCAVVHYPLFEAIEGEAFREYHAEHVRRTRRIVLVPMLLELSTAFAIWLKPPVEASGSWLPMAGAAFVVAVWLCTMLAQVPDHDKLSSGFDRHVHGRLLSGNLLRSMFWSGHALVVSVQCYFAMFRGGFSVSDPA